jgi:serine/threonine-protein kinase
MAIGTEILPGRYRDPRRIARGGMGEVYCAVDTLLGRPVAIKLLAERYAANTEIRRRFTREALAAARLSGEPSIVTIYDVGEVHGRPFIVMEYLAEGSLADVLRRGGAQLPAQALPWLEQAAQALDAAHARGVVHRDVKPANLLLDEQGHVHVADFGVASAAGLESLTQTGTVLGTAGYLAPEQAQGARTSPATDCYALGVVAFELLTGTRPFERDSSTAEAVAHTSAPVPSASQREPRLPPQVDAVFGRAMAKRPQDRYGSCAELVGELRAAFSSAEGTTRIIAAAPAPRRRVSGPLVLALLLLLAAGGIAAAFLATRGSDDGGQAGRGVTVTVRGTTVRETVTAQPPAAPRPRPAPTSTTGAALALQGYRRLQAGDAGGALPLLERAAEQLRGTHSLDEAYNDYNIAAALAATSGCSTRVLGLLDSSEAIQGHRDEIDRLRETCRQQTGGPAAAGTSPGRSRGSEFRRSGDGQERPRGHAHGRSTAPARRAASPGRSRRGRSRA